MILNIIIPVYNNEGTLGRLFESILTSYEKSVGIELKIIVIDDGSTDLTKNVIELYKVSFDNFVSIEQKNSGVYVARNKSLSYVKEGFVWFLDSDDIVCDDSLENIYLAVKNTPKIPDILHFGYRVYEGQHISSTNSSYIPKFSFRNGVDFLNQNDGRLYLWNNIYRVDFLHRNNLRFLAKSRSLEDSLFNICCFSKSQKVLTVDRIIYNYMDNPRSISRDRSSASLQKFACSTINVHNALQDLIESSDSKEVKSTINAKLNLSVLGFFYSMLVLPYDYDYVLHQYMKYKDSKLIPTFSLALSKKANLFCLLLRSTPLFTTVLYIRKLIR